MLAKVMRALFGQSIKPGCVVVDRYDGTKKTVERIDGDYAETVWFEGAEVRRGRNLTRNLRLT